MVINYVSFKIKKEDHGKTVREFLLGFGVSRKVIYKQEMFNLIKVNDSLEKLTYRLKENDLLSFKLAPFDGLVEPYDGEIEIVYEDEDFVIVNKPTRLLIHEDGNTINTLTNRVNNYYNKIGYNYPVLPAHRIDFDTSGLVLFAKHFISLAYLSKQFSENQVLKTYIALCDNYFKKPDGIINLKIGKDRHSNKQIVVESGKEAKTEYFVLEQTNNKSLVKLHLEDGRTHQIRVHLSHIGNPIVGDKLYGKTKASRMMLHATGLKFIHPRNLKQVSFEVKSPF